jgi:transcriptional regulator with XRE-family HTH domain
MRVRSDSTAKQWDGVMRLERDSFGRVLRAYRERRNISLAQLSQETKVSPQIWMDLEENDFSRWPTRIYARSWIRQYATRVGLDPEELVNEFCRLFQNGDRRTETLLRECAAVLGHQLDWRQELLPAHTEGDRRSDSRRAEVVPPFGSKARFIQKVPQ